jgi:aspartyl-tRNA(Asn)/glutamyl-tRNA(Gln) amidotransferase subunit B
MRAKEEANDYRYFPDPNLLPIYVTPGQIENWQNTQPELPRARKERLTREFGLEDADAQMLAENRFMADFFEHACAHYCEARKILNLICGPLARELNQRAIEFQFCPMRPEALAELAKIIDNGLISATIANDIFRDLYDTGHMPASFVQDRGLAQVSDTQAIEAAIAKALADSPAELEAYRNGKTKLLSFFVGQVMKAMRGKANPAVVNDLLTKHLSG